MYAQSIDDIRQSQRRRRRQLGVGAQSRAAKRLRDRVCSSFVYQQSQNLALYLANDGEIDCRLIIQQAWKDRKACYLPVLARSRNMVFVRYRPGDRLLINKFGIFEPARGSMCLVRDLDLVLLPVVAFDTQGHRIGMGGGYYDCVFADRQCRQGSYLLGVAHRQQQVAVIRPQPWDVVLDGVFAV